MEERWVSRDLMGLKLEQFFVVKWPVRRPSTRKAAKSSGTGGARSSHSNSLIAAHNATNTCLAWSMAPQLLPVQQAQHVQCAHASAMQHHVVARNMRSVKQTKCFARSARAIHTLFSRCSSSRLPIPNCDTRNTRTHKANTTSATPLSYVGWQWFTTKLDVFDRPFCRKHQGPYAAKPSVL